MQPWTILALAGLCLGSSAFRSAAETTEHRGEDPSAVVFDPDVVHEYGLEFYIDDWAETLDFNYHNGETYLPARLTYGDVVLDSIGVRYKGNSSYHLAEGSPKKPFKFDFNEYVNDQTFFGLKKLNFSNSVKDPSQMRERLAYDIIGQLLPAPRSAYANIRIDGELIGLYVQVEQVDKTFLKRHFDDNDFNLYKAGDAGGTLEHRGGSSDDYVAEFELKTNEDENDWTRFLDMVTRLDQLPDADFLHSFGQIFDLENAVLHLAVNAVISHFDSYGGSGRNFYLYDDAGQFEFIHWDLNQTFGSYTNSWDVWQQDVLDLPNLDSRPLVRRLLEHGVTRELYLERISEITLGPASETAMGAAVDRLTSLIAPHVAADPNKFYNYELFEQNLDEDVRLPDGEVFPGLRSFSRTRNEALRRQIVRQTVLPGDTDSNGLVDRWDLLPICRHWGAEGPPRGRRGVSWEPGLVEPWVDEAAAHADADGDGFVGEADLAGVLENWGRTHYFATRSYEVDPEDPNLARDGGAHLDSLRETLPETGAAAEEIRELLRELAKTSGLTDGVRLLPNPLSRNSSLFLRLDRAGEVSMTVIDAQGRVVSRPISSQRFAAGVQEIPVGLPGLPSGVYSYRVESPDAVHSGRLILIR